MRSPGVFPRDSIVTGRAGRRAEEMMNPNMTQSLVSDHIRESRQQAAAPAGPAQRAAPSARRAPAEAARPRRVRET